MLKKIAIALCCLSLAGCMPHFKEVDSFNTSKEDSYSFPDGMKPMPESGDPYTFSGIATGSGGTMARQSYATDNESYDFRDATATGVTGEISKDRTPTADPAGQGLPGTGLQFTGTISNGGTDSLGVRLRNPANGKSGSPGGTAAGGR